MFRTMSQTNKNFIKGLFLFIIAILLLIVGDKIKDLNNARIEKRIDEKYPIIRE